jgi:hypothetical protein
MSTDCIDELSDLTQKLELQEPVVAAEPQKKREKPKVISSGACTGTCTDADPASAELEKLRSELAELKRRLEVYEAGEIPETKAEVEATTTADKRSAPMAHSVSEEPHTIMQALGKEMITTQNNGESDWHNSPFKEINHLKPDYSGKLGEKFLERICKAGKITNISTGDVNSKDGTYDQIINGKKVEIKTARLGKTQTKKTDPGKFQHETLKKDGYDYLAFVDITPNYFYLSILPKFNMAEPHPLIGTKPTLRKGTSDVYKYDLTEKHIEKLIAAQTALKITIDTPIVQVVEFINRQIPVEKEPSE